MPSETAAPAIRVSGRWVLSVARALAAHPQLWRTALVQVRRLAPRGWWHRAPYLPLPAPEYLGFRSLTMYGDAARAPDPTDVVTYLRWCRTFPHPRTHAGRRVEMPAIAVEGPR